jgi:hypothetical protein
MPCPRGAPAPRVRAPVAPRATGPIAQSVRVPLAHWASGPQAPGISGPVSQWHTVPVGEGVCARTEKHSGPLCHSREGTDGQRVKRVQPFVCGRGMPYLAAGKGGVVAGLAGDQSRESSGRKPHAPCRLPGPQMERRVWKEKGCIAGKEKLPSRPSARASEKTLRPGAVKRKVAPSRACGWRFPPSGGGRRAYPWKSDRLLLDQGRRDVAAPDLGV